jgi:hypothetical protein
VKSNILKATRENNVALVKQLVESESVLRQTDKYQQTALHIAAKLGHKEIAEILIATGLNVDSKDTHNVTPLQLSTLGRFLELSELLLLKGADPNSHDFTGVSPMHIAVGAGNKAMLNLLLKHEGNLQIKTKDGATLLHSAALGIKESSDSQCWEIMKWLLTQNLDHEAQVGGATTCDILKMANVDYTGEYQQLIDELIH